MLHNSNLQILALPKALAMLGCLLFCIYIYCLQHLFEVASQKSPAVFCANDRKNIDIRYVGCEGFI